MSIPELNAEQIALLNDMCVGVDAFSECIPEESKDAPEDYKAGMDKLRDTEQLLILGLIKEITNDNSMRLAEVFHATGRLFRVFQITAVGKAMFSGTTRSSH